MELTEEALDYPDCRPPRPLDEIGITLPDRLQKMLDEHRAKKAAAKAPPSAIITES